MIDGPTYKSMSDRLGEIATLPLAVALVLEMSLLPRIVIVEQRNAKKRDDAVVMAAVIESEATRFRQSYTDAVKLLRPAVTALQQHVLRWFPTIDAYLIAEGVTVTTAFADLSAACGLPIGISA